MKKETLKTKVEITKETKSFDVSLSNQLIERPKVAKKVEYKVNYSETIASIKEVDISYQMKKGYFKAVNNVSFDIHKSEILGLIGESGSGKSTIGRAISGITSYTSGSIEVNGVVMPHNNLNINKEQKKYRIKSSQYIFQDPSASLNPNKTIEKAINDVYRDNFKYKDTLSNAWNKRFDEFVGQEFFEKLFRQPFGLYNKNIKSFNENNVLIKNEEDLMRDYFIQLSNTYINYKTDTSSLSRRQVSKELTDKEYLILIRRRRRKKNQEKIRILQTYKKGLEIIKSKKVNNSNNNFKWVHEYRTKKEKLLKFIIKNLINHKLSIQLIEMKIKTKLNLIGFRKKFINLIEFMNNTPNPTNDYLKKESLKTVTSDVSLDSALFDKRPLTLSGGQQQRAVIAKALTVGAKLLIADEPISALDVSIQAQIINTFKRMRSSKGTSILFIAHDLNVVRNISDRIMIMYKGSIVEVGKTEEIFKRPLHPYTRMLLDSIPDVIDPDSEYTANMNFKTVGREWFNASSTHKIFCTKEEFKKEGGK